MTGRVDDTTQTARGRDTTQTPRRHYGKLTMAQIQSAEIPHGKTQALLWDSAVTGLYLRCFAGGGRSWMFRYRADGGGRAAPLRSVKLGDYPTLSIDAARQAARALAGAVAKGSDPTTERQTRRAQARAETLGDLLAEEGVYERALKRRQLVNWKTALSSLRRELKPLMGHEPKTVTQRPRATHHYARGRQAGCRRRPAQIHLQFPGMGVQHDYAAHNVLSGWKRPPQTRAQRLAADEPNGARSMTMRSCACGTRQTRRPHRSAE